MINSGALCDLDNTGIRLTIPAKVPPNKKPRSVSGGANFSFYFQKR
jgi:hypothetical protein